MSKLLKLSFLVAIIALLLTSCNEDNPLQDNGVTPTTPVANLQQVTSLVTSDSAGCYEIVFPMNFILDDGTTASVANEEELEALFQAPPFPINIGFPVNLTNPVTGDEVTAANEEELDGYLAECNYGPIGGGPCDSTNFELGFIGCYEIQFPVSFVLEDGTTATANNNDELANIFQPLNPIVDYAYPLNLVNIDTQEPATAANEEELSELLMSCDSNIGGGEGIMFEFLGCYNIQFPATFILEDGTTVTAASHEELESLFDPSNPPVEYAYPLTLTNAITGEVVTANSHEELEALLMDCGPTIDFPIGSIGCYEFVFPATFIFADSSTVTVQSADELAGIFNPMNPPVDFGYPLNLHNSDTGENVTANNSQELEALLAECEPNGGGNWGNGVVYQLTFRSIQGLIVGGETCYSYQYPISVLTANGETLTATDDDSMFQLIFGNQNITDFVYPINVTDNDTGNTLTAYNKDYVLVWLSECN